MKKYIFIDDEDESAVGSIIDGLNDTDHTQIERLPLEKGLNLESLTEKIKQSISADNEIAGILLDLCLDGEGENRMSFTAPTLAQHVRSLAVKGEVPHLAIILCSTNSNLKASYNSDKSCHDLFDYKFQKGDDIQWEKVALKMNAIAAAYSYLNKNISDEIKTIIGRDDINHFDRRVLERFIGNDIKFTPYEIINFIIKDLLQHPGVLIKESVVAARLGINKSESADWENLISKFSDAKYSGALSDGWVRYWADKINEIFETISDGHILQILNASERVETLKDKYGLTNIVAATPIQFCESSYYGTICEGTKLPIDPSEGYEVYESYELRPWQDPKYISLYAYQTGVCNDRIKIKESEMPRLNCYRELLLQGEDGQKS